LVFVFRKTKKLSGIRFPGADGFVRAVIRSSLLLLISGGFAVEVPFHSRKIHQAAKSDKIGVFPRDFNQRKA
jgi:hypothetical protein